MGLVFHPSPHSDLCVGIRLIHGISPHQLQGLFLPLTLFLYLILKPPIYKLHRGRFGLNIRKSFFTGSVDKRWPRLPRAVLGSASLGVLRKHLDVEVLRGRGLMDLAVSGLDSSRGSFPTLMSLWFVALRGAFLLGAVLFPCVFRYRNACASPG